MVSGASISAWDIVNSLMALLLIPLVVGLLIRFRCTEHATDWQEGVVKIANLALVIGLSNGIAGDWSTIKTMFGSLGLIIIGSQLGGAAVYIGPAINVALVAFILPLALAVEIGHRASADGRTAPAAGATFAAHPVWWGPCAPT